MVETKNRRDGDDLRRPLRLLRAVDGVVSGVRRIATNQHSRLPHPSVACCHRCAARKGTLSGPPRRANPARLRGLPLRRAAGARTVVADPVRLRSVCQPPVRSPGLRLDCFASLLAVGLALESSSVRQVRNPGREQELAFELDPWHPRFKATRVATVLYDGRNPRIMTSVSSLIPPSPIRGREQSNGAM